jgi:penicillin-binding protein 1A
MDGVTGAIALETTTWAIPWTIQPIGQNGKKETGAKVSFGGKIKTLIGVLSEGDVVMVKVVRPPEKPKKKDKKGKKTEVEIPAEPEPPRYELEPVPMMEGALASTHLGLGGVEAMATGWDFDRSEVDRASALRQNGSTMKPIVYARAYEYGMPPSALVSMGATNPGKLVWQGLIESDNTVSEAVYRRVLSQGDKESWRSWGERFGLPRPLEGHASEVRGTDQTVLGMLGAFAIFGREGMKTRLDLVKKVVDREGNVLERHYRPADPGAHAADTFVALWEAAELAPEVAIDPVTNHLIATNLAAAVKAGTGQKAKALGREAAGKTGTLDYDVWFAGFTAERAAVSWLGADRRERTLGPSERDNRVYGSSAALPMWVDFMKAVDPVKKGEKRPGVAAIIPGGVVYVAIDPATGLLARPLPDGSNPPTAILMPHRAGTEPTEYAPEPEVVAPLEQVETTF